MVRTDTGWRLAALALAWLAGVAWHVQRASLWPIEFEVGLAAGAAALLAAWRARRVLLLGIVGAALLGAGLSGWRASLRLADTLPPGVEGRDLRVVGRVASLPQRGTGGLRFRFDVEQATLDGAPVAVPPHLALGWSSGFHDDATPSAAQLALRAGQRWRFTVRLRQPHGNLNPHGFDHELYLFERNMRATGQVRELAATLLDRDAGHPIERLRQRVRDAIDAAVPDARAAGVLAALAVGDQGAIDRDDWDLFRNAGVAHLMSISGLHVTMFAWLAGALIALAWRRSRRLVLGLPTPLAARWGGLLAALAYAVFSGWGVPSQRTVCMLAVVTLLNTFGIRWPWGLVLLVAAVAVTLFDPWALYQPGFWLSFAAVGLLMASAPLAASARAAPAGAGRAAAEGGARASRWAGAAWQTLRQAARTQLVATLGLTPLTLVFFHQVSWVGLLANFVAIPLITLLVTPLALLGAIATPCWAVAAWLIRLFGGFLGALTNLPGAVWTVGVAPMWAQAAGLAGAALIVLPLPWRLRLLAVPLVLPLLLPPRSLPVPGEFDLIAADVGQGSAVWLRTRSHLLLFDAGPAYSSDSDAGRRVLLPLLRALGDTRIDMLVLSHRDLDHVGGARSLFDGLSVAELRSSLEPEHPLGALAPTARRCEAGQSWTWDGVRFDMLWPAGGAALRAGKPNARSCVLRVTGTGGSALLTGDIEAAQEEALLRAAGPGALASTVLIVPHHGSKTSSTHAFVDAVRPAVAVFQAGYRNRFGHPADAVVARYRDLGSTVVTSPDCGAWRWSSNALSTGLCERTVARRYWHAAPQADPAHRAR